MNTLDKFFAFLIIIAALVCGLVYFNKQQFPDIGRETKTKTTILKTPETDQEYKTAFYNPIKINGAMSGSWIKVVASNDYIQAEKSFEIICPRVEYKNSVQFGYDFIYAGGFLYTAADVTYLRHYGRLAFGVGVMFNTWSQRQVFGGRIVGQVSF